MAVCSSFFLQVFLSLLQREKTKSNILSSSKKVIDCDQTMRLATIGFRAGEPESGVFGSLEPEPHEKNKGKPLGKKSQEPELEPLKN